MYALFNYSKHLGIKVIKESSGETKIFAFVLLKSLAQRSLRGCKDVTEISTEMEREPYFR